MRRTWLSCAVVALIACAPPPPPAHPIVAPVALAPCPSHPWTTLVEPTAPAAAYGSACAGLDRGACLDACHGGGAVACIEAGNELSNARRDWPAQVELYARACALGDPLGCTNLGALIRLTAPGWRPNTTCAAALFASTCAAREPNGCAMLGNAYLVGEGVTRSAAEAASAFARGCDAALVARDPAQADGVSFACDEFARALASRALGAPDLERARAAHDLACRLDAEYCNGAR